MDWDAPSTTVKEDRGPITGRKDQVVEAEPDTELGI